MRTEENDYYRWEKMVCMESAKMIKFLSGGCADKASYVDLCSSPDYTTYTCEGPDGKYSMSHEASGDLICVSIEDLDILSEHCQ